MSVVDSKALCKSTSEVLPVIEGSLQSIRDQLAAILESVHSAAKAADSFDSVERTVQKSVLQLGKQLMDLFVQLQGDGGEEKGPGLNPGTSNAINRGRAHLPKSRWVGDTVICRPLSR